MTAEEDAKRARHAANQAAYRQRQREAAATKKPRGAEPHGGGIVAKAEADAAALREARFNTLRQLPHAMSVAPGYPAETAARIRPIIDTGRSEGPPVKTKAAQERRAAAIRARVNAERLQGIGARRKADLRAELTTGPIADLLGEMSRADRHHFDELIQRITKGSNQAIAILFEHAHGQQLYSSAIGKILYETDRAVGFDQLEALAEYAETAAELYSPKAMRAKGLGDRNGRLLF